MIEQFGTISRVRCDNCKMHTSKWRFGVQRAIMVAKSEGFVFWRDAHVCAACDVELTADVNDLRASQ